MSNFLSAMRSGKVLLMDGAMGTEIQRRTQSLSLEPGERLNLTNPDLIRSIHAAYRDAGADVLLTNTFQANPPALARQSLAHRHHDIWDAALRFVRPPSCKPRFVLADVGPIENPTADIAQAIVRECTGVDGILLETWTSFDALRQFAAVRPEAVPLLVSFTFHHDPGSGALTTVAGHSPEECAAVAVEVGAVAIGANCGKEITLQDMVELTRRYRSACDLPTLVRPNAGTPTWTGNAWIYPQTVETMAAGLPALLDAGVAMVGGCCGTTPELIAALRTVIDAWNAK